MKKVRLLLCMLSLAGLGLLTACDDDDGGSGGGDQGGGGTNAVPLAGSTMDVTVTDDDPETEDASYSIVFGDTTYTATFASGEESGDYTYSTNGDAATLVLTPTGGDAINNDLLFDSTSSGSINTSFSDGSSESGTFTLTAPEPPAE